jgi:hypothetical protein
MIEPPTALVLSWLFDFCKVNQVKIENFGHSGSSEQLKKHFNFITMNKIEELRRLKV